MTATRPNVQRLVALQNLAIKFQSIERHVCYAAGDTDRPENDVEHSYALAMTAWFLAGHFSELNQEKVLKYALAHDLVEVYAGDTSVFADQTQLDSKAVREARALEQLTEEWPDFTDLIQTMEAYEARATNEALFVYALDKLMPVILNYSQQGKGWRKHKITFAQLHDIKKDKVKAHRIVEHYYDELCALMSDKPDLFPT